jgi:hypothetical protein
LNRWAMEALGQEATGQISLGVGIDCEEFLSALLAHTGEQPERMRLADSALEVEDGDRVWPVTWLIGHGDMVAQICRPVSVASSETIRRAKNDGNEQDLGSPTRTAAGVPNGAASVVPIADL